MAYNAIDIEYRLHFTVRRCGNRSITGIANTIAVTVFLVWIVSRRTIVSIITDLVTISICRLRSVQWKLIGIVPNAIFIGVF